MGGERGTVECTAGAGGSTPKQMLSRALRVVQFVIFNNHRRTPDSGKKAPATEVAIRQKGSI